MRVWSAVELRERDAELAAVDRAIYAARAGHGCVLAVEGPPGIGKTSLVGAARERAAGAGLRVLHGRGSELEADFVFGVVRQLLEPALFAARDDARARWFAGAAALAQPLFEEAALLGDAGGEEEVRFRRRHGLYWLIANLARNEPLLVAVDDAQWADEPSLGFLRHLAPRLEHLPVLLLIACRPQAPAVGALLVDPAVHVLRPASLSREAVASWIADELGRPPADEFATACRRVTNGNPFLLGELLRDLRADGVEPDAAAIQRLHGSSPPGVATSVLVRVAALPPAAGALARAVAVLGEAELPAAAALAGLERPAAVEAAGALAAAHLLEPAEPLRFVHPLVRTALYEELPPAERSLAHGQAARQLREAGASADRVAAQLLLAAPVSEPWALECLWAAAGDATRRGAPELAARFLERALLECEDEQRSRLLSALGRAEVLAGQPRASERLREAVRIARTPAEHAQAAVRLGRVLRYEGAGGEAVELLQRAAERLTPQDGELALLIVHELLATSTVSYEARRRLADRMAEWSRWVEQPPRNFFDCFVVAAQAVEAANRGRPVDEVVALAESGLAGGAGDDHLGRHVRLLGWYACLLAGRWDQAEEQARALGDIAARRGGAQMAAVVTAQRALMSTLRGHVDAAEADAVAALEPTGDLDVPPAYLLTAAGALVWVAAERGEPVHPLAAGVEDDGDSLFGRHLNYARACLDVAQGRLEQGVTGLLAVGEREAAIGWTGPLQFAWRSEAALALAALGEHERARGLAAEEVELARACGAPRALGIALRAEALLAGDEHRLGGLEQAVAALAGSGADLEHARALADLGATLRRTRQPAEARKPLRQAYELAARCSSPPVCEFARQELLAAGSRPRRVALSGPESLTPSELRVVELAARELMNREIAQELFVTEKTVETHLRNAYAKLGVRTRRELARALGDGSG